MSAVRNFDLLDEESSMMKRPQSKRAIALYVIAAIAIIAIALTGGYFLVTNSGAPALVKSDSALADLGMAEADLEFEFSKYVAKYEKSYVDSYEYAMRKEIFKQNLLFIQKENAKENTYTLGETVFLDLTNSEFKAMNNLARSNEPLPSTTRFEDILKAGPLPTAVDFRTKGVVTPVKDQGQCGSCWAFSTTGAVESANALANNGLISLSEQQLMDCNKKNSGCGGGYMDPSFQYVVDNGVATEASYPYTAKNGICRNFTVAVNSSGFLDVGPKNTSLLEAAASVQPVSVAIEANKKVFQHFVSGVIVDSSCGIETDHAVLVVGYNTTITGQEYYIVKNSWGPKWGEAGYVNIARGPGKTGFGVCGILTIPITPFVQSKPNLFA
ncbi:cathepsin CPL [Cardiosporidium cionae]|uniref:Cathepsin CPL n=1 Tax=Cardiosporidium cionae TaxID=476202 RepID=A0ABQ7J639_9APIC|nr:cathepsin CPL [Cardiosporidium cionae]|eukprot:KAF8819470.1 cathepsin CPL [Cardiosporidium cionae]